MREEGVAPRVNLRPSPHDNEELHAFFKTNFWNGTWTQPHAQQRTTMSFPTLDDNNIAPNDICSMVNQSEMM